jgi:hypothetical protein
MERRPGKHFATTARVYFITPALRLASRTIEHRGADQIGRAPHVAGLADNVANNLRASRMVVMAACHSGCVGPWTADTKGACWRTNVPQSAFLALAGLGARSLIPCLPPAAQGDRFAGDTHHAFAPKEDS